MAESKEGKFWKGVTSKAQKFSVRAKQKVLEKMQKADKTKDDVYEEFVMNFKKQENGALRMKSELVRYLNNLKFMAQSTKSLLEAFRDLYEPEWAGCKEYGTAISQQILLWEDVVAKVHSGVNEPLETYMAKFPDLKQKVAKQSRKQTDYDAARRKLEETRAQGKEVRKAEESYIEAKQIYDELTDELYDELPSFYDSRISFYATVFHSIASNSVHFHQEIAKVDEQWSSVMERLLEEGKSNVHTSKRERPVDNHGCTIRSRPIDEGHRGELSESTTSGSLKLSNSDDHTAPKIPPSISIENEEDAMVTPPATPGTSSTDIKSPNEDEKSTDEKSTDEKSTDEKSASLPQSTPVANETKAVTPETITKPIEAGTTDQLTTSSDDAPAEQESSPKTGQKVPPPKPPPLDEEEMSGVLYKVMATHNYEGQDEDELTFEKGQVILVVPYDDPDDQDEGWQMGRIQGTEKVGVFPENFTKRL